MSNDLYLPYEAKAEESLGSRFKNFFKKSNSNDVSTIDSEESTQNVSVGWGNSLSNSLSEKMSETQEAVESYKLGMFLLCIGFLILCFSMVYLPFIVIMPHKFNSLFLFGSSIIMVALATMMGTKKFFKAMYTKKNIFYSLCYTGSLVVGLYASTNHQSYVVCLTTAIVNIISLSYLLLANMPYGKKVLDAFWSGCYKGLKGTCKCLFSK